LEVVEDVYQSSRIHATWCVYVGEDDDDVLFEEKNPRINVLFLNVSVAANENFGDGIYNETPHTKIFY
jgi:hypothetical protein